MADQYLPVYINGEIVSADQARVSVFDRGFMRGDGLFETLRSYGGRLFRMEDHLARLDHGLDVLRYGVTSHELELRTAAEETLRASSFSDARVRIQVTRGTGTTEFNAHSDSPPTVLITVHPMSGHGTDPLDVIISSIRRDHLSPLAGIKTINYIPSLLAKTEAEERGAADAILINYAGNVAEGCTSNVFLVRSGELVTPDTASGALAGIVRMTILEVAASIGIPTAERIVHRSELDSADEVFLTSSAREVAPIARIDGKLVGSGSHKIAETLEREYLKLAEG